MLSLELLGPTRLCRDGTPLTLGVKKTLALLVLLSRSGPLPRARVVAHLWPDLDESSARRNLRRELARLRESGAGDAVQAEGDVLWLAPAVSCDIERFEAECDAGRPDNALESWRGPPFDGLLLDDAEAFEDWLATERTQLQAMRQRALEASAAAHEAQGRLDDALRRVEQSLNDNPLQEQRHRDAMRLLAALGRREEALGQFERCRSLLELELGLKPMDQTLALEVALRASVAPETHVPYKGQEAQLPPQLLPAVMPFVGRSAEVATMEAAWTAGRTLLIEGDAGVGKSRLAIEFAASHGPYAIARCRSGDSELPYASFSRALRLLMGDAATINELPEWVRVELARLLPELGAPPMALSSSAEHARFLEACAMAWLHLAGESFDAVILDDWHHADAASRALLSLVAQRRYDSAAAGARELLVYRDELDAAARRAMLCLCDDVQAQHLKLLALPPDAVLELMQRLSGAECPTRFATRLGQATGGNPFFLAETLRHLAEQGLIEADANGIWRTPFDDATLDYRELPVPAGVRDAVLARVRRLPDAAARVIEAAALASEPFAATLLAPACALSELDTVLAIEQAVQVRLLREHEAGGYAFEHDLVRQALDSTLSPTRRNLVHRRLALGAEAAGAPAATVALHHEACGDAARAVVHRMAAGDAALRVHALAEAAGHWLQALRDQPKPGQAMQLHRRLIRTTYMLDQREASAEHALALLALAEGDRLTAHECAEALLAVARQRHEIAEPFDCLDLLDRLPAGTDEHQQAQAMATRAAALRGCGQIEAARATARAALSMPGLQGVERGNLIDALAVSEQRAGRIREALVQVEAAVAVCTQLGDMHGVVRGMYRRGTFLIELGELDAAVVELQRGAACCEGFGFARVHRGILYSLFCAYAAQTQPALMLATAERGRALQQGLAPDNLQVMFLTALVEAHVALGQLGSAWECACEAIAAAVAMTVPFFAASTAKTCLELLTVLGARDEAARLLAPLDDAALRQMPQVVGEMWVARAQSALRVGELVAARAALSEVVDIDASEMPRQRLRLLLARAELAWAEGDTALALATLPDAQAQGMNDEMRLYALALRLRIEAGQGALQANSVASAQALLRSPTCHAMAALALHRAMAAAQRAGATGVPLSAAQDAAGYVQTLGRSLHGHPAQQAAFLRWCG